MMKIWLQKRIIEKANELIPDMIESGDLINVRGKLNDIPVNILFDSGCQTSTSFTSIIKNKFRIFYF